jgi:hypothetical protein
VHYLAREVREVATRGAAGEGVTTSTDLLMGRHPRRSAPRPLPRSAGEVNGFSGCANAPAWVYDRGVMTRAILFMMRTE